nr:SPARC protein [Hymenolepis microstoma]
MTRNGHQLRLLLFMLSVLTAVRSRSVINELQPWDEKPEEDECEDVKCSLGEYCKNGKCHCYDFCPGDWRNHYSKICVDGYTYSHTCDLYRNICYCREGDPRCGDERYFGGHRADTDSIIRYFAECQELTTKCNWAVQQRYFKYQFIVWLQQLIRSPNGGSDPRNVLLRPRSPHDWLTLDSVVSKTIGRNGENAGPLLSFVFCELDVDKSGMIEERELAMLTQVALPTLACLEIFLGSCISGRTISRDAWFNCFEIDSRDTWSCSNFV